MNGDHLTRFGESKDGVVADRPLIEALFGSLYKDRIIYHERITILSEVIKIDIADDRYELHHRPIKLLHADPICEGMYERWQMHTHLVASAGLSSEMPQHIYASGRLSTAYGAFKVWPGAKRVEYISNMPDEELTTGLRQIMW